MGKSSEGIPEEWPGKGKALAGGEKVVRKAIKGTGQAIKDRVRPF